MAGTKAVRRPPASLPGARAWLLARGRADVVRLIDQVVARWRAQGELFQTQSPTGALVDGNVVAPGIVTYAARTQTLSATLEGAIAGCLTIVTNLDGSLSIVLDEDCVTPEEIELILNTLSAHSFDFVAVDVPQGVHTIALQARISSSTSVQEGTASATGLVGKGTVTVESVRLVKGS